MKQYVAYIGIWMLFLMMSPDVLAQQKQTLIHGIVQTKAAKPLPGAIIRFVDDPTVQAVSGPDGQFAIRAEVGQQVQIEQDGQPLKTMSLQQDSVRITVGPQKELPIGYGRTRSQNSLTAAVSVVEANNLPQQSAIINPENLLYGKIPGLMVLSNGGQGNTPTGTSFFIRGRETFRDSSPLILVDGFQYTSLRRLAPRSIKSVSVLKDAAALAMYGQQGANGVILVETKRGGDHPLRVQSSYMQSLTQPVGLPTMLGASQYARAVNEALANDGLSARYSQQDLQAFESGNSPYLYPNVDWFDEVLRNYGTRSNMNMTFDGGGETIRYFAHLNYAHYNGIFTAPQRNIGYKTQQKYGQFNFRSNLDIDLTDKLLLKFNIGAYMYDSNVPSNGSTTNDIFDALYRTPSAIYPVTLPDGTWGGTQIYTNNPVAKATDTGYGNLNARQLSIDAHLRQDLDSWLKGLEAEAMIHFVDYGQYLEGKNKDFQYGIITPVRDQDGTIVDTMVTKYGEDTDLDYSDSFEQQARQSAIAGKLSYSAAFGDDNLDAMLLVQQHSSDYDGINNVYHYRKVAGNLHYALDGTYFFDVAASYAGRNLLPEGKRYNFFPAVSAGWLISNEAFLEDVSFLDRLKIRASWGITGSDDVPNNKPFLKGYSYGTGYHFGEDNTYQAGTNEDYLPAIDFGIARSYKTDIGIEVGLFEHLDILTNLFYGKRKNILTGSEGLYSGVIGIETPDITNGIVENRGIEIALDWRDAAGAFAYTIGGQFTYAKNEIVNQNEEYRPYNYLRRTGQSVGQRFGLQAIGFFKDEQDIANSPTQQFSPVQPGDIKYKDQNNDGIINDFDEIPIGYSGSYPEIYYSATLGIQYKNISLSALFQGVGHMTAYLNTESVYWPLQDNNTISNYYYNHRWTPQTAGSATLPRLTTQSNSNNFQPNSIWLRDQSYLKLRDLKLSYTLPLSVVQSLHLDRIKLIARGQNLFSWDNIPVGSADSFDSGYPLMRMYSLGIDIAF